MKRWATAIVAAGALSAAALVSAGCDRSSATPAITTTTTPSSHTAAPATLKPRPGLLTSDSCQQIYELARAFSAALSGDNGDLVKTTALLSDFAVETPTDIRPDFRVLASAYTQILAAFAADQKTEKSVSPSPSRALLARMDELSGHLNMAKVITATQDVSAWASRNCANYGQQP